VLESAVLIQSPRPGGMMGFLKLNFIALFSTSLDPETKMGKLVAYIMLLCSHSNFA